MKTKFLLLTIVLSIMLLCSCGSEKSSEDDMTGKISFSTDFVEDDWVLGEVPREKMVPLKVVKQFSFRPTNEEPTFEYLNMAAKDSKLYVQNNYDGKINVINMTTLEIEDVLVEHSEEIYADSINSMFFDEKGTLFLTGNKNLYQLGEKYQSLKNTYSLSNFTQAYSGQIYAVNLRQNFSPGYDAFEIYDYDLNYVSSAFENPLWDDLSSQKVAAGVYLSCFEDQLLLASSWYEGLTVFDFTNKTQRVIKIEEMEYFAEHEEFNLSLAREHNTTDQPKPTYGPVCLLENDIFIYKKKGRCSYVLNTDLQGKLKQVFLIRVKVLQFGYILNLNVVVLDNQKPRLFLYYIGEKGNGERAFPVCVFEPAS